MSLTNAHVMRRLRTLVSAFLVVALDACAAQPVAQKSPDPPPPNYARPLPLGRSALRPVTDPGRLPDLAGAYRTSDPLLIEAIDESLVWFAAPSSRRSFPFEGITHERARESLLAMRELLERQPDADQFIREVLARFDIYESVGYDDSGTVLFTGYYSPVFTASRVPTGPYAYPLYTRPPDLLSDPQTGAPLGRKRPDGAVEPYPTRREIETTGLLAGRELVWLADPLSVYMIHVNGSAKLRLVDSGAPDEVMYVGYAGKTDRAYRSLGQAMIDAGLLTRDTANLAAIKREFERDPDRVVELMYANESYVFFTEYGPDKWPAGSLGVRVTPERTLATDKKIYPRGGLVLVDTKAVTFGDQQREFLQFMLDQDTGGAIQAPGRADIFIGIGPSAEILAGGQYAEGRLYYFFLKPEWAPEAAGAFPSLPRLPGSPALAPRPARHTPTARRQLGARSFASTPIQLETRRAATSRCDNLRTTKSWTRFDRGRNASGYVKGEGTEGIRD